MGGLIRAATGKSAIDYSRQHLFGPLDINDYHLEVDLSGSPRGTGITNFQTGLTPTGHGLWLKPRDLAKLGQLYLDGGVWQGKRILPSKWVTDSWLAYSDENTDPAIFSNGEFYGLQWWGGTFPTPEGVLRGYVAQGFADQFIIVVPQLDLVVVSNADNGSFNGQDIVDAVRFRIVPATETDFDPVNDAGITGTWASPQLAHQGFMLEVIPTTGQMIIYWMTFEPGTGKQMWLIAAGQMHSRRALLEFLRPVNGVFGGDQQAELQSWGEVDLIFTSCTEATMSFKSPIAGVEGEVSLVRITPNVYCQDAPQVE
jgi:CubicO group peptidase (beta-lactamase class C family)